MENYLCKRCLKNCLISKGLPLLSTHPTPILLVWIAALSHAHPLTSQSGLRSSAFGGGVGVGWGSTCWLRDPLSRVKLWCPLCITRTFLTPLSYITRTPSEPSIKHQDTFSVLRGTLTVRGKWLYDCFLKKAWWRWLKHVFSSHGN